MRTAVAWFTTLILCAVLPSHDGEACTAFCAKNETGRALVSKSYDFFFGDGAVYINKAGQKKVAVINGTPWTWTADWASITFNQYGIDFPSGGMNEHGLVVEVLWLKGSSYPKDKRQAIGELQWIQYQLDKYKTVEEVLAHKDDLRVEPLTTAEVHYFVCDRSAACAAVEFLGGDSATASEATPALRSLANSTYRSSVDAAKTFAPFGGSAAIPTNVESKTRFARGAAFGNGTRTVDQAFQALDSVKIENHTRWHIVYDTTEKVVHFRTVANSQRKTVALSHFPRHCAQRGPEMLDIDSDNRADLTDAFALVTQKSNAELIQRSLGKFQKHFGALPAGLAEKASAYFGYLSCDPSGNGT